MIKNKTYRHAKDVLSEFKRVNKDIIEAIRSVSCVDSCVINGVNRWDKRGNCLKEYVNFSEIHKYEELDLCYFKGIDYFMYNLKIKMHKTFTSNT